MDKNVELLLAAEKQVNAEVSEALKQKKQKLDTIKREADIALRAYKAEQKRAFDTQIEEVSSI